MSLAFLTHAIQPRSAGSSTIKYLAPQALPTTCPEDFDLEDSGSLNTDDFANSDCLPAVLAAEAVHDTAMSASPGVQCALLAT